MCSNGKLVNNDSLGKIFGKQTKINEHVHYGYGTFLAYGEIVGEDRHKYYHTGGGAGVHSINIIYPEKNVQIIVITNIFEGEFYKKITPKIDEIVLTDL